MAIKGTMSRRRAIETLNTIVNSGIIDTKLADEINEIAFCIEYDFPEDED
jgi:hypothetical protein